MKLRIKGNSIRFRLSQAEIRRLAADDSLWETTDFGSSRLEYGLDIDPDASAMAASFDDGRIGITLPARVAREWAGSDQVSLHGEQPIEDGTLKLLVEKDFQCLQPREDEDESDMFPNPKAET